LLICISRFDNESYFAGAIWTKSQTMFDWWTVEINFRVSGRGRIGADGLVHILLYIIFIMTFILVFNINT